MYSIHTCTYTCTNMCLSGFCFGEVQGPFHAIPQVRVILDDVFVPTEVEKSVMGGTSSFYSQADT